jgi:hypothetical protein
MKQRSGFVSNSSSSSFIIGLPKKPETEAELAEMLGDCAPLCGYGTQLTSEEVVHRVFGDIQGEDSLTQRGLDVPFDADLWIDSEIDHWSFAYDRDKEGMTFLDAIEELKASILETQSQKFKGFDGLVCYELSYSDDGGESSLEHGDIFRNIPHNRESHH